MALSNELQNLITREATAARQWHKEIAPDVLADETDGNMKFQMGIPFNQSIKTDE